jgi:hypothetical protein
MPFLSRPRPGHHVLIAAFLAAGFVPVFAQTPAAPAEPIFKDFAAALIGKLPVKLALDPFYEKYADAMGIPIIASGKVSDLAILIARDIMIHMLSERPDIRRALITEGQKVGIIGKDQQMSDIPEYKNLKKPELGDRRLTQGEIQNYEKIRQMTDAEYWNRRARGLGGVYTTCGEENLLGIPGTRYFGEQILVHEFAHAVHRAIRAADPGLAADIEKGYTDAMALGLFKGHYGSNNSGEYWCEGTQWWFWSNYEYKDGDKIVYSPADLRAYEPKLYELLGRVYPTTHHLPMDPFWNHRERSQPAPKPTETKK